MIFADISGWPDLWNVYDGVHVLWVCCEAYIIAHNELYRVADAWTASHKLRKRIVLHRIACSDDCDELIAAAVSDASGTPYKRPE